MVIFWVILRENKLTLLYKLHTDYFSLCLSVILSVLSHEEIYLNICRNVRVVPTFVIHCIYIHIYIYIYIIIIIKSCHQHRYPWPSLATPAYCPLLPTGFLGYIPYQYISAGSRFELVVLPLLALVKGSIGVYHLCAHPYFSSSVLRIWFI